MTSYSTHISALHGPAEFCRQPPRPVWCVLLSEQQSFHTLVLVHCDKWESFVRLRSVFHYKTQKTWNQFFCWSFNFQPQINFSIILYHKMKYYFTTTCQSFTVTPFLFHSCRLKLIQNRCGSVWESQCCHNLHLSGTVRYQFRAHPSRSQLQEEKVEERMQRTVCSTDGTNIRGSGDLTMPECWRSERRWLVSCWSHGL